MRPILPEDYRPSENEEFMGPLQVEYFRQKLLRWRAELLADSAETLRNLQEESLLKPDLTDRATLETERAIELRTRDRERKLISKIDAALSRLDSGTYGYCEETDEPIGIRRLEARALGTQWVEARRAPEGSGRAGTMVAHSETGRRLSFGAERGRSAWVGIVAQAAVILAAICMGI